MGVHCQNQSIFARKFSDMFSLIRLIIKIAFILLVGLLVLAFFTNPTLDDYKREAKSKIKEQFDLLATDPTLKKVSGIGETFSEGLIDNMMHRKNYYVCSVFTIETPAGNYDYLGAYNFFYPLQDDDPLQKFIQTINELNKGGKGDS